MKIIFRGVVFGLHMFDKVSWFVWPHHCKQTPGEATDAFSQHVVFQHGVQVLDDAPENGSVPTVRLEDGFEEHRIREHVEHVVDARLRFLREMALNELLQHRPALVERLRQEVLVKREFDLVVTDHSHGHGAELLFELVRQHNFLLAELFVSVQDSDLDDSFDQVLGVLLRSFFAAGVLAHQSVHVVQQPR